jgi:hypothetical protein
MLMHAVRRAAILDVAGVTAAAADSAAIELRAGAWRTIAAMGADPRGDRRCRKRRLAYRRRKKQSRENQIFHIVPPKIYRRKMLPESCNVNAPALLLVITSRALARPLAMPHCRGTLEVIKSGYDD